MEEFIINENDAFENALTINHFCQQHKLKYQFRKHNFTETYSCIWYLNQKSTCNSGFTKYLPNTYHALDIFKRTRTNQQLCDLISYVMIEKPNGCPDFIANIDNKLAFVEVKLRNEQISVNQEKYLNWCSDSGGNGILLRIFDNKLLNL